MLVQTITAVGNLLWPAFDADVLFGIHAVNEVVAGTRMPRISDEVIEAIIHANPFEHWWHDNTSWRPTA